MSAITLGAWPADSARTLDPSASGAMYAPNGRSFAIPQHTVGHRFVSEQLPTMATNSRTPFQVLAPRRKRASRPKVRTGCTTCKIRRIKCDETKPSCIRCTSTGRKCDGYEFPSPPTSTEPPPEPVSPPPKRREVTFTGIIVPPSLSTPFQGTAQEKRIFHRFQVRTVPAFSGGSEAAFWQDLVLQVGQQEPVVRNAIIALGSLHEDYQIRGGKYDPQLIEDPSYRQVTLLYGKALRQLNDQLSKPTKTNAKLAIICSILFTCFEVLRRNNMAAVVHYQQGMRQLMRQMKLPEADDSAVTQYSEGTIQAQHRQIPHGELDIIMRVFARYDIQACTFSKDQAERLALDMPKTVPDNLTIGQVRNHLDTLLICVYQLVKSDLKMYRYWNKAEVPRQWQERREEAVSTFTEWLKALEKFLEDSPTPVNTDERRGLLGLQLQIKVALIMLNMCIDCKPETTYDNFYPEFENIVSRTEQLFQSLALVDAKPLGQEFVSAEFYMELGLVHPLFFVAIKCRHWNLRRRAIALLRKAGKEGVWEGPIMAVLAQKIMRLEEQGLARGTLVPERNRFHEIKKNVDYDGRLLLFELTKPLDDTYQNWHVHRDTVAF